MKKIYKNFYFTFLVIFIFTIMSIDFYTFYNISYLSKNTMKINSNLIVLTGGSNRIKQTLDLFFLNFTENHNLLISGAGKGFTKKTILKFIKTTPKNLKILDCCITIENQSTDTHSNAEESYKWIRKNNFKEVTLITSDYHMPRALIEFKHKLNDIKIIPFSLKSDPSRWTGNFRVIFFEYFKYKATKFKIYFL